MDEHKRSLQTREGASRVNEVAHPVHILDVDALRICIELQDELLQVEEGPLVANMLPYL